MQLALIVATDLDGVIGRDNQLPWHLPADLQRFKRLTMGKPMIMGRKTYESIGKPLPGRTSVVLTGQQGFVAPGCLVAHTPEEALEIAGLALAASQAEHGVAPAGTRPEAAPDEVMVIGGAAVFRAFLPLATRLYWTQVQAHVPGILACPSLHPPAGARSSGPCTLPTRRTLSRSVSWFSSGSAERGGPPRRG